MHLGWLVGHFLMLAWVLFAGAWIAHEAVEQRTIRAAVDRVARGETSPEELIPYDFEAALYLVQELNQDESWDEGVRLARGIEKLLKGRIRPSARRRGSLVRVTFFQQRALEAALASWPEGVAARVRRCLEGEQPGDIPLEADEREALNGLARSWKAEPSRRATSVVLRALLEGAPLDEVKLGASEIELFWTVIGNWRLQQVARARAAEKLARVIGRPRKGAFRHGPGAGRRLAALAAEWNSKSYSKRRGGTLEEMLSGRPLEEVSLSGNDEARLRAVADAWKRSAERDEREAAEAILEAFGGPRFGEVVFEEEEIEFLSELAREKLALHLERRRRLLRALTPVLKGMTDIDQHHMFDIVNLLADPDEDSRALGYQAVEVLGEFVERAVSERPGPSSERLRRRFVHLLTSSVEKRTPNPYLVIETSDATKLERNDLLSELNLRKRKLVTRLLGRFATDSELGALSRLLGDADIGGEMEGVFRARGLLPPGEPVGEEEPERHGGEDPG